MDIRSFFRKDDGTLGPTKKGIALNLDDVALLREHWDEIEREAIKMSKK